jgi:KDO2-lipid IV(A) lauroyltransferase
MTAGSHRRTPGFFGGEARSDSSDDPVSLWRLLTPRHWRAWIFVAWLWLSAALPWRFSLALHKRLGRWLGGRSRKSTAMVEENLALCFPALLPAERTALAGEYFANMGACVAELGLAWFGSIERIQALFEVEGTEHLERALADGHGVFLCAGHFTPIELASVAVAEYVPRYALLYNRRRSRLLSEMQRRSRERYSDVAFEKRNLRPLLRSLRENSVVWFSADEAQTGKSSALIPFFGEPALTNTALNRLARLSGARLVPLFFCRKADDSGYRLRFEPPLENFPSEDAVADTRRLVALLEEQIRECPAQYLWKQKRFRRRREEPADSHRMATENPASPMIDTDRVMTGADQVESAKMQ